MPRLAVIGTTSHPIRGPKFLRLAVTHAACQADGPIKTKREHAWPPAHMVRRGGLPGIVAMPVSVTVATVPLRREGKTMFSPQRSVAVLERAPDRVAFPPKGCDDSM